MMLETRFDSRSARSVTHVSEAELCLREFIRQSLGQKEGQHITDHNRGFDLYLPWFFEIVEYVEPYDSQNAMSINDLQRLYMDAAWNLVMQGVLRIGPKTASSASSGGYGTGYSVMVNAKI